MSRTRVVLCLLASSVIIAVATACGGVSDGDGSPDAGSGLVDAGHLPNPPDGGTSQEDWPANWAALEEAVLVKVNERRAAGAKCGGTEFPPVPPLTMDARLRQSARLHSKDMADRNYFNHMSLDGRTPAQRIRAAGYTDMPIGENIAAGVQTAESVVQLWMQSTGHCRNIMEADFVHIGIGYAYGPDSMYGHYWTQNFGG